MSDAHNMYGKVSPKQAVNLAYGCKIRYARALVAQAHSANRMYAGTFTEQEIVQLEEIQRGVIARAEKVKIAELSVIADPKADRGSETEHRTYNGK